MNTKTIPLDAVKVALSMAALKKSLARVNPAARPHKRTAAFTDLPSAFVPICRNKRRKVAQEPMHSGFLNHGDLDRVVSRVHYEHGAREVRRIWGKGLRDMHAELEVGSLR